MQEKKDAENFWKDTHTNLIFGNDIHTNLIFFDLIISLASLSKAALYAKSIFFKQRIF